MMMMMMMSSARSSMVKKAGVKRASIKEKNQTLTVSKTAPKLRPIRSNNNGAVGVLREHNDVVHKKSANLAPEKVNSRNLRDYTDLLETVARVETSRLPAHLISHDEIVNIGALTIHLLFTKEPDKDYNVTYLSTAIKWAVRNELRYRYKWYSFKNTDVESDMHQQSSGIGTETAIDEENGGFDDGFAPDAGQLREAVYESVLSVDGMMESETPNEIRDGGLTPAEHTEQTEMGRLVRDCMTRLPERERQLLEARFFKHMRMREIGEEFSISPSRASRVVQSALTKIKLELQKKGVTSHQM
jgi:RNA polymerase sigma factor (sigma-70 family)